MLVSIALLEASADRYHDWKKAEKTEKSLESVQHRGGVDLLPPQANLDKRKEMLEQSELEPVDFAYERAIGKNDSVYSNFTEIINAAKRKVGRIVLKDGAKNVGYATGFMVSERLLLTNWHVFNQPEAVKNSEIQFDYELDVTGRPKTPIIFQLAPEDFFYAHRELDYCLIAVRTLDIYGKTPLSDIGYHFLNPALGKLAGEGQEFLNIIHHPAGDYKQLSIRENRFTKILENMLWYETDTASGSSGSPVFNDQFQVVALHHMGVPKRSKDGKHYLDKEGKVLRPDNGTIDIGKVQWIANEGVRISKLTEHALQQFPDHPMVAELQTPAPASTPTPGLQPAYTGRQPLGGQPQEGIQISISPSTLAANKYLSFLIQGKPGALEQTVLPLPAPGQAAALPTDLELELRKITIEEGMDYSACKGYDPNFLGIPLPLPQPLPSIGPLIAKLKGSAEIELKYHHFSAIQHATRKMPILSAVNVDGSTQKRQDVSERDDTWLRDNRIDVEAQLNDKFYRGSGFDKGHMSRREDANWGDTPTAAKLSADLTCMYTNACPQVAKLNQSRKAGLWGKLEQIILERGVEKESGQRAKISVFNGPIFSEKDPVFKGVQIPMDFWKVVVWPGGRQRLKATAFKLSQIGVVGEIDFEVLDFDQNLEFQTYQCSISSLATLTQFDFSAFLPYDRYKKKTGAKDVRIDTAEALVEMV